MTDQPSISPTLPLYGEATLADKMETVDADAIQASDAEARLAERFTKAGVVMAAGGAYHAEQAGYFRLIFTAEDGRVEEGIRRYARV